VKRNQTRGIVASLTMLAADLFLLVELEAQVFFLALQETPVLQIA